jgi:hypothetical protein
MPAALLALSLVVATPASDGPVPRAAIEQDLLSYYGGELTSAYVVLGLGIAYAGAGIPLVAVHTSFSLGFGIPLLSLGVLEGIGGIIYAIQVRGEIRHYQALLASNADDFKRVESAHISGTRSRFWIYRSVELALALGGAALATYGFVAGASVYKGVGLGLAAVGVPFFIMDSFNDTRAGRYRSRLERFDPKLTLNHDQQGWRISLSARF